MSQFVHGTEQFGGLRAFLWPIHRHEMKKISLMLLIFFFVAFNYNILRTMKDTLVVTAESSGAEVIPFIKVWAMFPGAVLMTLLFTQLSNRLSREKVFYIMMSIFIGYFILFAYFLYPNRDMLHSNSVADTLQVLLPSGFKGFIAMVRNWTFTSFYVMSELWSNIILMVLCWGFANQVTKLNEAKRFYAIFGFGINLSGIIAGQTSVYFSRWIFNESIPIGTTAWEQSLIILITLVIISGILAMGFFYILERRVLSLQPATVIEGEAVKGKLSLRENFSFLLKSRYMLCITVIVIAYNVIINLVEVLWKDQLRELYSDSSSYNLYINQVSTIIGILATVASIIVSGNSIRKYGWTFTAMITPFVLLVTSIGFFGLYFSKEHIVVGFLNMTPLALLVLMGTVQNILARGAKYTVFDATKEMAFVPLTPEDKVKGKAAIDGICNRFGKSGGSIIHSTLLIAFSSFAASAPYIAGILCMILVVWMIAVRRLGKEFSSITSESSGELITASV